MKLLDTLSSLPRTTVWISGVVLMVLAGIVDQTTGPTVNFSLFYLLIIAFVSWGGGWWYGLACALLGTALRTSIEVSGLPDVPTITHIWNTVARFCTYAGFAAMTSYTHKRYSQQLQRAREKYTRFVETAIEGVIVTNAAFRMQFVNGRAAGYLGWRPEELTGKDLFTLIPDDVSQRTITSLATAPPGGPASAPFEIQFVRHDGKPMWALVSTDAGLATDRDEFVLLLIDISDRKKSEEGMQIRYKQISAMQYLSSVLSLSFQLDERLNRALDSILEVTHFSSGVVFLLDEERKFTVQHNVGLPEATLQQLQAWHESLNSDELLTVLPESFPSANGQGNSIHLEGIKALAVIPLISKGRVLGVLDIMDNAPHEFTEDERLMLQTFGRQVGIAVENSKLYEDTLAREKQVRQLSIDLARVQEDERKKFARELHDGLSQILTTLKIMTELALKHHRTDSGASEQHLHEVISLAEEAQTEAKQIAYGLRPSVLDDFGLKAAINMLTSRFEKRTGIAIEVHLTLGEVRFDSLVETNIYRIVQELLANAAKHSAATRVVVQLLERDDVLALTVADNGKGFDARQPANDPHGDQHSGLRNLRERVEFLGGTFRTESTNGEGSEFLIELPKGLQPAPDVRNEIIT